VIAHFYASYFTLLSNVIMIGVSIILYNSNGEILLGKRKGSHGAGSLANPGGHLEGNETNIQAGVREVLEETGIDLSDHEINQFVKLTSTDDCFDERKSYLTYHYAVQVDNNVEPQLMEPNKCEYWKFYSLFEIVRLYGEGKLFLPLENLLRRYEMGCEICTETQNNIRADWNDLNEFIGRMNGWLSTSPYFNKVYLFSGPAGSGKGTQGKMLQEHLGLVHTSTGEIFRRIARENGGISQQIKDYMNKGEIIPPDLAFPVMREEFSKLRYKFGFILDGYPKDLESREFLLEVLKVNNIQIEKVFYFDMSYELNMAVQNSVCISKEDRISSQISLDVLTDRLSVRLLCTDCELNYHPIYSPPMTEGVCNSCSKPLTVRSDDQDPDTIKRRVEVFREMTLPVIEAFETSGVPVVRIDACLKIADVTNDIIRYIQNEQIDGGVHDINPVLQTHHHSHIDGKNLYLIEDLIHMFHSRESGSKANTFTSSVKPDLRHKIYPVQYLKMGKQATETMRELYDELDNFHIIDVGQPLQLPLEDGSTKEITFTNMRDAPEEAVFISSEDSREAFSTVMYGTKPNFKYMYEFLKFLKENATSVNQKHSSTTAIQFEYEEEIYSESVSSIFNEFGVTTTELDIVGRKQPIERLDADEIITDSMMAYRLNIVKLDEFEENEVKNVPTFEIHHGFDIPKQEGETEPPFSVVLMNMVVEQYMPKEYFDIGGWFIFEKDDRWAYRTNEFAGGNYASVLVRMKRQQIQLISLLKVLFDDSVEIARQNTSFKSSIEIVHKIWSFA
jgi:adenylate kinase